MIVIYVVYLFVCFISYARVLSWFSFIIVCTSTCLHLEIKHMGNSIWNMFSGTDSVWNMFSGTDSVWNMFSGTDSVWNMFSGTDSGF